MRIEKYIKAKEVKNIYMLLDVLKSDGGKKLLNEVYNLGKIYHAENSNKPLIDFILDKESKLKRMKGDKSKQ